METFQPFRIEHPAKLLQMLKNENIWMVNRSKKIKGPFISWNIDIILFFLLLTRYDNKNDHGDDEKFFCPWKRNRKYYLLYIYNNIYLSTFLIWAVHAVFYTAMECRIFLIKSKKCLTIQSFWFIFILERTKFRDLFNFLQVFNEQ